MKRRKKKEVIRIPTPQWSSIALTMLETFPSVNEEGKDLIRKEFARMAKAADAYNELT